MEKERERTDAVHACGMIRRHEVVFRKSWRKNEKVGASGSFNDFECKISNVRRKFRFFDDLPPSFFVRFGGERDDFFSPAARMV
jgi:hypothetical protein